MYSHVTESVASDAAEVVAEIITAGWESVSTRTKTRRPQACDLGFCGVGGGT